MFDAPFLGVLGGMGPMASAVFMQRLTALTPADIDQQHIPTILWSDPRVPDRLTHYVGKGPDPVPWLLNGIHHLEHDGAGAIAIPCNTAHLWYDALVASASVPILHIVSAVIDDLHRQGVSSGVIGLLGTAATLRSGLYQRELAARGYRFVLLGDDEHTRLCASAIAAVKANRPEEGYAPLVEAIRLLRGRGAEAVVLGCTELPVALPHARRAEQGTIIVDSIDALARAAIAWHARATGRDEAETSSAKARRRA